MSCGVWRRLLENWKRTVCATRGTEIKLPLVTIGSPSGLRNKLSHSLPLSRPSACPSMSHRLIRLHPRSLTLSGLPIHVARNPRLRRAPFPRAPFSVTHDLPGSLVLSLQLKTRYPRGFSAYPAASQRAVFALSGLPVYLVASRLTRFSLMSTKFSIMNR